MDKSKIYIGHFEINYVYDSQYEIYDSQEPIS